MPPKSSGTAQIARNTTRNIPNNPNKEQVARRFRKPSGIHRNNTAHNPEEMKKGNQKDTRTFRVHSSVSRNPPIRNSEPIKNGTSHSIGQSNNAPPAKPQNASKPSSKKDTHQVPIRSHPK